MLLTRLERRQILNIANQTYFVAFEEKGNRLTYRTRVPTHVHLQRQVREVRDLLGSTTSAAEKTATLQNAKYSITDKTALNKTQVNRLTGFPSQQSHTCSHS